MASSKGVPLQGDRSAWDDTTYPDKHAKSVDDATYDYHTPLSKYDATEAPGVGDDSADGYAPGSRWVDVTNDKAYVCLDATQGAAVWIEIMERGDYDEDADGLIDAAHGGTELDTSSSDGIPHLSSGIWSILKRLSPGADSELTIATGAITVTQLYHRVDTEADAASSDLDTINGLANDGELLILHPEHNDRSVVLKHGTGNIYIPGGSDITLDDGAYHVLLIYDAESTNWCVVGGGSGGGGGGVVDAADTTYTPAVLTDWDADTDPGNADGALDQLAERVDDNEIDIGTKADDDAVVHDTGNETVEGIKTFASFPVTPSSAPTTDYQTANKKYVDDNAGGGSPLKFYWAQGYPHPSESTLTEDSYGTKFLAVAEIEMIGARVKCDWVNGVDYRVALWDSAGTTVLASGTYTGTGDTGTYVDIEFTTPYSLVLLTEYYITVEIMDNNNIKKYYGGEGTDHTFMKATAQFSGTPTSQRASPSPYAIMPIGTI